MRMSKCGVVLVLGIAAAVFSACSFNLTTANIRSVKVSKDEEGKQEATNFGPDERVYVNAEIANNVSKVKVRFRVLYDDVEGKQSGSALPDAEKTVEVDGSRMVYFWITLPKENFPNGRYKAEITMFAENGDQKGQKTATFNVEGFNARTAPARESTEDSTAENAKPENEQDQASIENASEVTDRFGNGSFEGFCRNKISGQRARLSFELTRKGNDISGSTFVGPPLRGSGVVTGKVSGDYIELVLETRDVRQNWTIYIYGNRTVGGGFEGTYRISDGQYGVFSVDPVGE